MTKVYARCPIPTSRSLRHRVGISPLFFLVEKTTKILSQRILPSSPHIRSRPDNLRPPHSLRLREGQGLFPPPTFQRSMWRGVGDLAPAGKAPVPLSPGIQSFHWRLSPWRLSHKKMAN
jgi:hypothetical protein